MGETLSHDWEMLYRDLEGYCHYRCSRCGAQSRTSGRPPVLFYGGCLPKAAEEQPDEGQGFT